MRRGSSKISGLELESGVRNPPSESQVGNTVKVSTSRRACGLVSHDACANLANFSRTAGGRRARGRICGGVLPSCREADHPQLLREIVVLAAIGGLLGRCLRCAGDLNRRGSRRPGGALPDPRWMAGPRFYRRNFLSGPQHSLERSWPAWHTSRADLQIALNAGGREKLGRLPGRPLAARSVVIVEVALTARAFEARRSCSKEFRNAERFPPARSILSFASARVDLPEPSYSIRRTPEFSVPLEKLKALPASIGWRGRRIRR